jgi:uncharacterized protein (DUF2141 family)
MKKNSYPILLGKMKIKITLATLTCAVFLFGFKLKTENPKLLVQINKVKKKGTLYISVCSKSSEWSDNGMYTFKYEPVLGQQNTLEIDSIPNGTYAIAMYQDINGNEKLDTNFLGIPTEPYAFSNNRVPVFSEPSFEKCKFQFNQQKQEISINLLD